MGTASSRSENLTAAVLRVEHRQHAAVRLQEVELPAVEQRRRHVGRVLVVAEDERGRPGHLALRVLQPDRLQRVAAEAGRHVHDAVGVDRRGDRVHGEAGRAPALLAGREVVAHDAVRARDHHLRRALARDDERGGPRRRLVAVLAPALLAGRGVERHDEVGALVVPGHDQRVAVDRGRGCPRRSRCASASCRAASATAACPSTSSA